MAPTIQVPTVGQANSTEAVKVTNSLTNLAAYFAAGIPASDVAATSGVAVQSWRTVSSNTSAAARDLINSNAAGLTITLPAPATNALIGIWNSGGTAGSPTVVSGTNIYGVGLSAASSFKLGTLGSFALLQSDGASWLIVGGQQDTGWVALTLATNVNNVAGLNAATVRLLGDRVWLRGSMKNQTGGNISGAVAWATIPAAMRPNTDGPSFPAVVGSTVLIGSALGSTGSLQISTSVANNLIWALDGSSYSLT